MIIEDVKLENFISHEQSDIMFETGINIIVGHNGAGKSSIIDAIRFALFSEKRGSKMEELIKKGRNNASVQMKFKVDSYEYEIFRGMTLGKYGKINRNSWLKRDGVIVAETFEGVSNAVKDIIKVSKDLFLNSIFVKQGEMDSLISEDAYKRKELFSKIIGIDILSKSAEKLRDIINEVVIDSKKYESSSQFLKDVEEKIVEMNSSKERIQAEIVSFEQKSAEYKKRESEAYSATMAMNEKVTRLKSFIEERTKKEAEIKKYEERLKSLSEKISQTSSMDFEKKEIEENPLFKFGNEINEYFILEARFDSLSFEIKSLKKQIESYENDEKTLNSLRPKFDRFNEIKAMIENLEGQNRENEKARGSYEHLSTTLEELRARVKALQNAEEALKPLILEVFMSETIDEITVSTLLKEVRERSSSVKSKMEGIKANVGNINKTREELRKNRAMLEGQNQCPICGTPLTEEHSRKIQEEYDEKDLELVKEIESISSMKKELQKQEIEISDKITSLEKPQISQYIKVKYQLDEENKRITEVEKNIQELKERYEAYIRNKEEIENFKKSLGDLEKYANEFSAISLSVKRIDISALRERLTDQESEHFNIERKIEDLLQKIGFSPDKNSQTRVRELNKRHEELRLLQEETLKMKAEREQSVNIISQIKAETEKISSEINLLSDSEEKYNAAKETYDKARSEAQEIDRILTGKKADVRNIENRLLELNEQLERFRDESKKYEKLLNAISALRKIRSAFDKDGIQSLIRKDSSVFITNRTRNYLNSFNLNFDDVEIDENFDIKVTQNGAVQSIDSLSGGERTALAIAVRLSIANYLLSKVSTMIMDEPTNFLDQDRRNNLKDIIQYSLKNENIIPQVIMITHHNELTSVADMAYEVTKRNGKSIVSTI